MQESLLAGRFRVGSRLGAGAVANVYRAEDLTTGMQVAVKMDSGRIARAEARLRFEREAAALAVLASPHVVELVAEGEAEDGSPYLVLELLRGHTFDQRLEETGAIAPPDLVRWLAQAAAAVDLAHGMGIVHRDLKPSNLFLHESVGGVPVLKVLDFGLVTDMRDAGTHDPGVVVGTPLYMAPEQARGQAVRIGPATDVWAMGMLAIKLLTGEDYWRSTAVNDIISDVEAAPLYPPSARWGWLPRQFDAWFLRSTHRVPERRWRSVRQQALALTDALPIADAPVAGRPARFDDASTLQAPTPPPVPFASQSLVRPLIGRRMELAALEERLVPGALVTLTGPGGVGKSRVAAVACAVLGERLPDGAWLVPLSAVVDPAAVPDAIAQVLALAADAVRPALDRVAAALGPMRALVVLDGFEHLLGGRERLAEIARRAPGVAWLITSRVPLGVRGEQLLPIEPLELPPPSVSPVEAASYAAVKLFVARAREALPGFSLAAENVADVVALCRLADGLPLAIELAAAQLRTRPLAEIGAHLEAAGGAAGVRGAVAWSYGLLDERERTLLRHLALLPAGEALPEARERLGQLSPDFAASIERLVNSQLLTVAGDEPPLFTMLETVRDFCASASAQSGETEQLWKSALAHLARVAQRADEGLRGRDQAAWLATLDAAHDNLRAALTWASASDPVAAMQLAGRLAWYWYLRGNYEEGSRWLEGAVARAPATTSADRLRALAGAGRLAFLSCRYERGEELLVESSRLAVELGDRPAEADIEQILASVSRERGEYATARTRHQRCLALWRHLNDQREVARTRNYLTFLGWIGEDPASLEAAGAAWRDGAEAEFSALGDREGLVWSLLNRGALALYGGDEESARRALGRALAESVEVRYQEGIAWSLNLAGLASLARRALVQARAQLRASLRVHRRLGDLWRCASVLEALADLSSEAGEGTLAAVLFGGAGAIRRRIGAPVPRCERALHDLGVRRAEAALGAQYSGALARGAALTLDELVTAATGVAEQ